VIELSVQQGTPEWKAGRKNTRNASDYPSAQGLSKKFSRAALVREAATGIEREFSPYVEEKIFPDGHRIEAMARPLAEKIIGEELFPIVATSDDGYLGASSDGATMLLNTGWECKQWNIELAEAVASTGRVPETHVGQLDQQGLVFGFERILFMVTDGTPEKCVHCWHTPTAEAKAKIRPTWKQFDEDVAEYQRVEKVAAPVADTIEDLPALTVQLVGQVTSSNLATFRSAVMDRIQSINTTLVTDQDFANADKMVKFLDDGEKRLDLVKSQALAQTESIDQLFRTIDSLKAEMRSKRLTLDKLVKAEKESRKVEITAAAATEYAAHCRALNARLAPYYMPGPVIAHGSMFGNAIKGLKSLDSMRDKVSVALANAKIEASQIADRIEANRKTVKDMSLLPDFPDICTKSLEDFSALLAMRISQRREADERRLESEREKIRAEESRKAQLEAAEQATKLTDERARAIRDVFIQPEAVKESLTTAQTIKLGEICARLGFTVTADFMTHIGFPFVAHDKNAKLYRASDFPDICEAIAAHVLKAARRG
jgi:predicted phage-related endonuclease